MPAEKSGQNEFDFEYGDDFGAHILEFDPTFTKVLVRYNPEGDREMNAEQAARLKRLVGLAARERPASSCSSCWCRPSRPSSPASAATPTATTARCGPGLMVRAIAELQDAGIEADVWKIEGLDSREDCERVAEQTRRGGRDDVTCVVLGRGGNEDKVIHWLQTGAGVPGYIGFAVGRTIWWDALNGLAGRRGRQGRRIRPDRRQLPAAGRRVHQRRLTPRGDQVALARRQRRPAPPAHWPADVSTWPPTAMHGTPALRQWAATTATTFPFSVWASILPSAVTQTTEPASRSSRPASAITSSPPGTAVAPISISIPPIPPPAPAPGRSGSPRAAIRRSSSATCSGVAPF